MNKAQKKQLSRLKVSQRNLISSLTQISFLDNTKIIEEQLAQTLLQAAYQTGLQVGVLINRRGQVTEFILGSRTRLYLPDLGRLRSAKERLRGVRLLYADPRELKSYPPKFPQDIYTDLEKLRLDSIQVIQKENSSSKTAIASTYAYLTIDSQGLIHTETESVESIDSLQFDYLELVNDVETNLASYTEKTYTTTKNRAILVGVYPKSQHDPKSSMSELKELARSAGLEIADTVMQIRNPDPSTLIGRGKLEDLNLLSLKLGAEMVVFDSELKPTQWRVITNQTELKVLDRSMLILDIFAQRAHSSEGRLQVELAQLKYNLPRLAEKEAGLSRLSGGIGGRGPGETKLEVGRRRARDRIRTLEQKIDKLGRQRSLRAETRLENKVPIVALLGYTNVGKSTLFNRLTASKVIAENKLFATLDPTHRRLRFPSVSKKDFADNEEVILTDTVGFIRDLPAELKNAFRSTLDELVYADLLIEILDVTDPNITERFKSVQKVLQELELSDKPKITCLNKTDLCKNPNYIKEMELEFDAISISANTGKGIEKLLRSVLSI